MCVMLIVINSMMTCIRNRTFIVQLSLILEMVKVGCKYYACFVTQWIAR